MAREVPRVAALRRHGADAGQIAVVASVITLAALAWLALWELADTMAMPGMDEAEMADMAPMAWSAADFALRLAMWVTMMVGMMLPGALPMILLFRRVVAARADAGARVALFVSAYVLLWSAFSLAATLLQQGLEATAWLGPMSMRSEPWLGGALLVGAGVYQWLPAKQACLTRCRSPLAFLMRHSLASRRDSLRLGLVHGAYCVGCCWALMLVLFAVGAMNLLAAALLGIFVLLEKLTAGPWLPRLAGLLLVAWGAALWLGS